ncbi:MAG: hypothetical protein ACPGMZ_11755, partial [Candidatus Puniceispirillaceae bacterium]
MLTNSDITELVAFRQRLHRRPELSGEEEWTAAEIAGALDRLHPDDLIPVRARIFDRIARDLLD